MNGPSSKVRAIVSGTVQWVRIAPTGNWEERTWVVLRFGIWRRDGKVMFGYVVLELPLLGAARDRAVIERVARRGRKCIING